MSQASGPATGRSKRRSRRAAHEGVHYPRWFWPSFSLPAIVWLLILFVLPLYTVVSIAFGTVDPILRGPLPVYQPWYWSTEQFAETLDKVFGIFGPVYVHTFEYVIAASAICLVLGYAVAYYVARYGGRHKGLLLVLLISPFWISYLMRMLAWINLLDNDGYINRFLMFINVVDHPIGWLEGRPLTVIMGLVYGYIPYMILPLYGFLDRIDVNLLESGRDLGGSPFSTFWRVTLPLSKPGILAGRHHRLAADVRRLLHEQPAVRIAEDDHDRQPDRRGVQHDGAGGGDGFPRADPDGAADRADALLPAEHPQDGRSPMRPRR